jgi:hypothetical protein
MEPSPQICLGSVTFAFSGYLSYVGGYDVMPVFPVDPLRDFSTEWEFSKLMLTVWELSTLGLALRHFRTEISCRSSCKVRVIFVRSEPILGRFDQL